MKWVTKEHNAKDTLIKSEENQQTDTIFGQMRLQDEEVTKPHRIHYYTPMKLTTDPAANQNIHLQSYILKCPPC